MTTREYMAVTPPAGHRIAYGPLPEQFGELRVPSGTPGPHPVVVVIHGGWWRAMYDLTYCGHLAAALTLSGIATWNIEYRRIGSPEATWRELLTDVTSALAALTAIAPAYALDLGRIVVTGHSAGGHLAAWLAAKQTHPSLDVFGEGPPIVGAVPVAGALDLDAISELAVVDMTGGSPVHALLGGTPADVPDRYALASPARLVPVRIPVVAVHGSLDDAVPLEISQRYVSRAQAAGDAARLVVIDGADHFAPFNPVTDAGGTVRAAIRALVDRQPAPVRPD
jgi:acetyl esterase/lipase